MLNQQQELVVGSWWAAESCGVKKLTAKQTAELSFCPENMKRNDEEPQF